MAALGLQTVTATFHVGDAIEVMEKLPEKSVDLVLTSPPFWSLRSYLPADHESKVLEGGSEATPGEYVDWLIDVVEACDRVLAPHGSLCVELGDTYSGSGGAGGDYAENGLREGQPTFRQGTSGALPKSLSLIPELFRLTLVYGTNPLTGRQTERWRLRNVVRWVRPNPPVGALSDKFRPATSELMVFCKSAKRYFDLDAVREPYKFPNHPQIGKPHMGQKNADKDGNWGTFPNRQEHPAGAPPLDWWKIADDNTLVIKKVNGEWQLPFPLGLFGPDGAPVNVQEMLDALAVQPNTAAPAPPLDWWNIPPGGYQGAHYAVFPPELCIKPIKAMCPERVCRVCGEPSRRIAETTNAFPATAPRYEEQTRRANSDDSNVWRSLAGAVATERVTLGFTDCGHNDWRPGVVLDPFVGSGTTLLVATGHGRDAIGIDLDSRNFDLAIERVGPLILERAS